MLIVGECTLFFLPNAHLFFTEIVAYCIHSSINLISPTSLFPRISESPFYSRPVHAELAGTLPVWCPSCTVTAFLVDRLLTVFAITHGKIMNNLP